jgi:hypothetical protein
MIFSPPRQKKITFAVCKKVIPKRLKSRPTYKTDDHTLDNNSIKSFSQKHLESGIFPSNSSFLPSVGIKPNQTKPSQERNKGIIELNRQTKEKHMCNIVKKLTEKKKLHKSSYPSVIERICIFDPQIT